MFCTKVVHITFPKGNLIASDFAYLVRCKEFHLLMNTERDDPVRVNSCLFMDGVVGRWGVYHNKRMSILKIFRLPLRITRMRIALRENIVQQSNTMCRNATFFKYFFAFPIF